MGLFGLSKKEAWKQLSTEINANYIQGGFWKGDRVELEYKNWTIYLDTYTVSTGKSSVTYTRVRAPFIKNEEFYFQIYTKGFFSELGKAFGMQDIIIGYEEFDDDYIIKGNDENQVIKFFSSAKIRSLIKTQPKIKLEIKKNEGMFGSAFKENENQLYFTVSGVIKDINLLKKLFELFIEVLNKLEDSGIANSQAPDVKLY